MKRRAPAAPPTPSTPRERLREFALFIEAQSPEKLAAEATNVHDTLHHCARIQAFFRHYVVALKSRAK